MAKRNVSASIVREWASENMSLVPSEAHLSLTGANGKVRGRIHPALITVFNRSHKNVKYDPSAKTPRESSLIVQQIVVTTDKGRKVPRKVTLTADEVRTLTGHTAPGRIPNAVKTAAAFAKVSA